MSEKIMTMLTNANRKWKVKNSCLRLLLHFTYTSFLFLLLHCVLFSTTQSIVMDFFINVKQMKDYYWYAYLKTKANDWDCCEGLCPG